MIPSYYSPLTTHESRSLTIHLLVLGNQEAYHFRSLDDPAGVLAGNQSAANRLRAGPATVAKDLNHARRQVRQRLAVQGDAGRGHGHTEYQVIPLGGRLHMQGGKDLIQVMWIAEVRIVAQLKAGVGQIVANDGAIVPLRQIHREAETDRQPLARTLVGTEKD